MGEDADKRRWMTPTAVFLVCAGVYTATLGNRIAATGGDGQHFVRLAESYLAGQLSVVGDRMPGQNDWAKYDGRWYVSFPPFPALVILPAVAVWGTHVWDRLFWALLAGLGPAFVYLLLRALRDRGASGRSAREDLLLTGLFAFGSVYYFTAVQGSVWFAAHVVASALIPLYLLFSLDARRPVWAGVMLALCFVTRPSTLWLGFFFVVETLASSRPADAGAFTGLRSWLVAVDWSRTLRRWLWFVLPLVAIGCVMMWLNASRFDDPFEFGHSHLQIRWRDRVDTWGLFNYHYLSRNLAIAFTSLPWLSAHEPYLKISRHGLALWVTTPQLLWLLWPRLLTPRMVGLIAGAIAVALVDLLYHNSGWVQFGYRFSLDYMIPLIALLALGGRRFGWLFKGLMVWALVVNLFGAITFDRVNRYYDDDSTQRRIFQPD